LHIVDRRLNPSGKTLANRERFVRRAKSLIRKAVHESSASRNVADAEQAEEAALPTQVMHEPWLLTGNYIMGDTIPPQGGAGRGGSEGSRDGEGQDDFRFTSRAKSSSICLSTLPRCRTFPSGR
jgi:uncharacterized sporulation protein YeaH/YhbH (DUF444 family)